MHIINLRLSLDNASRIAIFEEIFLTSLTVNVLVARDCSSANRGGIGLGLRPRRRRYCDCESLATLRKLGITLLSKILITTYIIKADKAKTCASIRRWYIPTRISVSEVITLIISSFIRIS